MEKAEQLFIKGFNAGYQLSKHDPALLAQLLQAGHGEKEYLKAMLLGKKEHDREKVIEKMKQSKDKAKGKDTELER